MLSLLQLRRLHADFVTLPLPLPLHLRHRKSKEAEEEEDYELASCANFRCNG